MSETPVPQDFDRAAVRRAVNEEVQRFQSTASLGSLPSGGELKRNNGRALRQAITALARVPGAIHSYNGDGNILTGETAAVCYVGAQNIILLRIFYRTSPNTMQQYEYALCFEGRGPQVKWVGAKGFYRDLARQQSKDAPPIDIDMSRVRATAEELLTRLRANGRALKPKGAQLDGSEVEDQIKSLNVVFSLGVDNARTAGQGSYRVICFVGEGSGLCLRVFRHDPSGWLYASYVLEVTNSRPNSQHRGRRGNIVQYRWK